MKKILQRKIILFFMFVVMVCFCSNSVNAAELINHKGQVVEPLLVDANTGATSFLSVYSGANETLNPGIIEYGKTKSGATGLPAPFDRFGKDLDFGVFNYYPICEYTTGRNRFLITYCLGHTMPMHYGATLPRVTSVTSNGVVLPDRIVDLIIRVFVYGYDAPEEAFDDYRNLTQAHITYDAPLVFATQIAAWIASNDSWGTTLQQQVAEAYLNDPADPERKAWAAYNTIVANVNQSYKDISFMKSNANNVSEPLVLKWNPDKNRFECTITDTNGMITAPKISYDWMEPTGNIKIEYNGNSITFYSNVAAGTKDSPITVRAEKKIFGNRVTLGLWQNLGDSSATQPLGRLVRGERPPSYTYTKVYTEGIKVQIHKNLRNVFGNFGDAVTKGAKYGVYKDENCNNQVAELTIGDDGYSNKSEYIPYQKYYIKEKSASEGTVLNDKVYELDPAEAKTDADGDFSVEIDTTNDVIVGDLEIHKELQESDYDEKIDLSGAKFKVTLKSAIGKSNEADYTYYTDLTDSEGRCKIDNLPYGRYVIEECVVPDCALKIEDFEMYVSENGKPYKYTKEDVSKKMKIVVRKQDYDADLYGKNKAGSYEWTQGDASFVGAEYTIYRKNEGGVLSDVVDTITINHKNAEGYWCAESEYMWTGTYYVKETKRPEGYLIDENIYTFSQDPATQVEEKITIERALENGGRSTEKVERGSVKVDKYDNNTDKTLEAPANGAVLWLVLNDSVPGGVEGKSSSQIAELAKTNPIIYYEATVNEKGRAEFIDEIYHNQYKNDPYTIPYGAYTIIEIAGSENGAKTHFFNKPQEVKVTRQKEEKYYIIGEEKVTFYLQIQKMDADTNEEVNLAGAVFRVWDVARGEYVEQKYSPDGNPVKDFVTGENGKVTLPQKIDAGEYIIYEITPPPGYYSNDKYRLNPEYEGIIGKGGKHVIIDKEAMGISPDSTGEDYDLYYKAEIEDEPLKGKLQIVKTGEQFAEVTQVTEKYNEEYSVTKPKFVNKGLKGVTYEIYAAEDIKSQDGTQTYVEEGTKVDTIVTNENGIGESTIDLYCGEYRIVETVTPKGYITDNNIPNVVIKNEGPEKVKTTVKELSNVRQKLSVIIDKVFEDVKYSSTEELKKESVFGIYANQDFMFSNGELAIPKDTLVATTKVEEGVKQDTSKIDLPAGEYYVKELEASYPYSILEDVKNVTLEYQKQDERVDFGVGEFVNTPETATVTLIKLSTSTLEDVILNGDEIDTSTLDEEVQALLGELSGKTTEEVKAYLKDKDVKFVAGAKYGVYIDENCTEPLYVEKEKGKFELAIMETDESGLITMGEVPLGTYYFKEIEAPIGYQLSTDVIKLELTLANKDAVIYQALIETPVIGEFITKTDIFTGDVVPDCVFEIRDEDEKVLLHDKTNKKGDAYIPTDIFEEGEKYYFVEIEAPGIYDLNTEPHEFTAHFDENGGWATEKISVENRRKTGKVTILKTDEETGEPLEGCKFSIVLLDENGDPYVNNDGETIYLVENAVTGEDGKYVIEEAPYGTYKFIEVEAPEGYEKVEEEMENYVFEVNENSQEVLFEVTNTGDIAVYALCVVALVSVLGIVYAIRRNKKID